MGERAGRKWRSESASQEQRQNVRRRQGSDCGCVARKVGCCEESRAQRALMIGRDCRWVGPRDFGNTWIDQTRIFVSGVLQSIPHLHDPSALKRGDQSAIMLIGITRVVLVGLAHLD